MTTLALDPSTYGGSLQMRIRAAYERIGIVDRPEVWIHLRPEVDVLAEADARAGFDGPLAGVLLAVKDNIDVAGLPTTAAAPGYSYVPARHAPAVARLIDAGAIVVGKTNLDQFATGLTGTRSPYGAVRDAYRPQYISGGSSSGSAVAVALGLVDLALGTDTAGSGRVPAAFAGIVGMKPTRGLIPISGVVPAVAGYDCVSTFARTLPLAGLGARLCAGVDITDPYSRIWPPDAPLAAPPAPRVAVPAATDLRFLTPGARTAFAAVVDRLAAAGGVPVEIDLEVFLEAARLLYGGALVAARHAAVRDFLDDADPSGLDPTVRQIISSAGDLPAYRYATDLDRLAALRAEALRRLGECAVLLVPTTTAQPTIAEVTADPIGTNNLLGTYTNFANLLDLCALAVPSGFADGGRFGVTVLGRAHHDAVVADIAGLLLGESPGPVPPAPHPPGIGLVVFGAHLSGLVCNGELTGVGARLIGPVRTVAAYRMHRLDGVPARPALVRVPGGGASIAGELWSVPPAALAGLATRIPVPLSLGRVELTDGTIPLGFLGEAAGCQGAPDITCHGGWRAYVAAIDAS